MNIDRSFIFRREKNELQNRVRNWTSSPVVAPRKLKRYGLARTSSVILKIMRFQRILCSRKTVHLKRPERWQNNDWILHVDKVRTHTAHIVLQFLAKHSTTQLPHLPYSPDLAPNDFFLYLKLKMKLKGREAVRLKRPERWQNNDWILHVGNARPHTAHVVLQFLAKHSTIQIPHPPYSPDLAPNDFFLYPKLKMNLKGRKFDNVDMIQAESKATLRNLSKSDFISCFDNWKKRWNGCIEAGGAYFEKD
ncbi:hypothetical protein LAZ67_3004450 [Cordylochernes scorpioides]|uniref:Transposase n=1 Tax=Cordylochernes scorpioides TaxID=51811 RepID=A0ABY6KAQ1_9ARAC|nr:hypothetical protein LAZ67_3004450 [Cordylochernes scorpioides]